MSKDSHNATAQNLNSSQAETEQAIATVSKGMGSILLDKSDTTEFLLNCEPTEREILAAMVSELCAECVRVSGEHTGYQVYFYWTPGADSIRVHAGPWGGDDLHSVISAHVFLDWGTSNGALSRLIARVSALGAES
mgnify:CR=1 FL=1